MTGRHAAAPVTWSPVGFIAKALLVWCVPAAVMTYAAQEAGAAAPISSPDTAPQADTSEPHTCRCVTCTGP